MQHPHGLAAQEGHSATRVRMTSCWVLLPELLFSFSPHLKIKALEIHSISLMLPTLLPGALQHFTHLRMGILYVAPTRKWLLPR